MLADTGCKRRGGRELLFHFSINLLFIIKGCSLFSSPFHAFKKKSSKIFQCLVVLGLILEKASKCALFSELTLKIIPVVFFFF